LQDKSQTKRDLRHNHVNEPVRTARAIVQHYNEAIHITVHNTETVMPLHPCLQTNITSQMWS